MRNTYPFPDAFLNLLAAHGYSSVLDFVNRTGLLYRRFDREVRGRHNRRLNAQTIKRLAEALGIPPADVAAAIGWDPLA